MFCCDMAMAAKYQWRYLKVLYAITKKQTCQHTHKSSIQETCFYWFISTRGRLALPSLPKAFRFFSTSILGKPANVLIGWEKMDYEWIIHVGFSSSQHVFFCYSWPASTGRVASRRRDPMVQTQDPERCQPLSLSWWMVEELFPEPLDNPWNLEAWSAITKMGKKLVLFSFSMAKRKSEICNQHCNRFHCQKWKVKSY